MFCYYSHARVNRSNGIFKLIQKPFDGPSTNQYSLYIIHICDRICTILFFSVYTFWAIKFDCKQLRMMPKWKRMKKKLQQQRKKKKIKRRRKWKNNMSNWPSGSIHRQCRASSCYHAICVCVCRFAEWDTPKSNRLLFHLHGIHAACVWYVRLFKCGFFAFTKTYGLYEWIRYM